MFLAVSMDTSFLVVTRQESVNQMVSGPEHTLSVVVSIIKFHITVLNCTCISEILGHEFGQKRSTYSLSTFKDDRWSIFRVKRFLCNVDIYYP